MTEENKTEEEKQEIKENIQSDTGKSFEEMQELATKTLKIHNEAKMGRTDEQQRTSSEEAKKIGEMSDKMKNSHLASDLIQAGLERDDYSIGATDLEHTTYSVADKISGKENSIASNSMDVIFVKFGDKTVSLPEFLQQPKETLTEKEQDIQKSLSFIYNANSKEVLFQSFPDWRENQPLTIDTTEQPKTGGNDTQGEYKPKDNTIHLSQSKTSVELLAHELKHAEQCGKEIYGKYNSNTGKVPDALALHQLSFLEEAQAFAFGYYVKSLQFPDKKSAEFETEMKKTQPTLWPTFKEKLETTGEISYKDLEKDLVLDRLKAVYSSPSYKDYYDSKALISSKDTGISEIPDSFHFKKEDKNEIQTLLQQTPKEARLPNKRFQQLLQNGNIEKAKEFIHSTDLSSKDLISCLKISVKGHHIDMAKDILSMRTPEGNLKLDTADLNKLFTARSGLWMDGKALATLPIDEQLAHKNTSGVILDTMLSLKTKEGTPVIQTSSVDDLTNKTKSGSFLGIERPDIHSSIQQYHQDHPEDKRFNLEAQKQSTLKSTLATLSKNGESFTEKGRYGLQSTLGNLSGNSETAKQTTNTLSTPVVASVMSAKKQH